MNLWMIYYNGHGQLNSWAKMKSGSLIQCNTKCFGFCSKQDFEVCSSLIKKNKNKIKRHTDYIKPWIWKWLLSIFYMQFSPLLNSEFSNHSVIIMSFIFTTSLKYVRTVNVWHFLMDIWVPQLQTWNHNLALLIPIRSTFTES